MTSPSRKQLWSVSLGNLFEHYDTALFGFMSPFLAPLIFPHQKPLTALIITYTISPLGIFARPMGSLVFGYIGGAYGREYALFLTLTGMAFISGCIALSPTYAQIGILAPILFFLWRMMQNFFAAGESMGGAIYILEHTPEKSRDLISGFYSASAIGGHLLASLGVFLFSHYHIIEAGWRLLYIFGCLTALFGSIIRRSSRSFQTPVKLSTPNISLREMFWKHRQPLVLIILCAGFANATYSMALVLMNGFIPLVTSLTKAEVMEINTYLLVADFCALPFFGWIASKVSREYVMLTASLGVVVFSTPLILSLQGASLLGIIGVRLTFVIFGIAFFAPFHAWAQQLIPSTCRYAVISFGYALGSQLLGSPTAALALWCFKKTGMISSLVWYWISLGLASTFSIAKTLSSRNKFKILESSK